MDPLLYREVTKVLNLRSRERTFSKIASKIDLVHSRPYHSQSQGKMEVIALFVRALHSKMEYDSLWGGKVFNWAKALARYQGILNEELKRSTQSTNLHLKFILHTQA